MTETEGLMKGPADVEERLQTIYEILCKAMTIAEEIVGDNPGEKAVQAEPAYILARIEESLERIDGKAGEVLNRLVEIQERL